MGPVQATGYGIFLVFLMSVSLVVGWEPKEWVATRPGRSQIKMKHDHSSVRMFPWTFSGFQLLGSVSSPENGRLVWCVRILRFSESASPFIVTNALSPRHLRLLLASFVSWSLTPVFSLRPFSTLRHRSPASASFQGTSITRHVPPRRSEFRGCAIFRPLRSWRCLAAH